MIYCNISTVKHSTTNFEVVHTVPKSTVALKMFGNSIAVWN